MTEARTMTQPEAKKVGKLLLLLLPLLTVGPFGRAATTLPDMNVLISGTVVAAASCQINNGNDIQVDFGEVVNSQIDGVNYKKTFDLNLNCRGGSSNSVRLKFNGTVHPQLPSALSVSGNPGMGIQMMSGGSAFAPSTWLKFDYSNLPIFSAVPVKVPGVAIVGGYIGATVVIEIDYQ
ncbi:fimbrial protein [Serratia sp. P2ACOL2]|nr:fimbrial protein [Serratia sp. P2ACOL2]